MKIREFAAIMFIAAAAWLFAMGAAMWLAVHVGGVK